MRTLLAPTDRDDYVVLRWHVAEGDVVGRDGDTVIATLATIDGLLEMRVGAVVRVREILAPEGGRLTRGAAIAVVSTRDDA